MHWQQSPYLLPLSVTTLVCLGMAAFGWRNRKTIGAKPFTILMLLIGWWSFTYLIEIASVSLANKLFWLQLQYVAISLVPLYLFIFIMHFTGKQQHPLLQRPLIYIFLLSLC